MTDLRRCTLTALAVVGLSVSGHLLGGGRSPSPVALLLVAVLALVLAALIEVASPARRARRLAVFFGAFQVIAHGVLHTVATSGAVITTPSPGHAHHGGHLGLPVGQAVAMVPPAPHAHGVSPLMLTTHLLATVLLAWLLGPARQQVRRAIRRVLRVAVPVSRATPRVRATAPVVASAARDVVVAVGLRGPPRFVRA